MAKKESANELVIREVRNNRVSIYIEWLNGDDLFKVTFRENPLPSFYRAIEALSDHACSLGDFPAKDASKVVATAVKVSPKGDNMIARIGATKTIKRGKGRTRVLYIETPPLAMYADEENKKADHMSPAEAKAIEKVLAEAKKYVNEERAQGKIEFAPPADEDGDDEKVPETAAFPGMDEAAKA